MPPEPILTRWGTWIEAAIYYADNFKAIKSIVFSFDEKAAESIKSTQNLIREKEKLLKENLAFIKANFSFIPAAITNFENSAFDLNDGIATYDQIRNELFKMRSPIYYRKFDEVIARNSNFDRIRIIRNILYGRSEENADEDQDDVEFVRAYSPAELVLFKTLPLSSTDRSLFTKRFLQTIAALSPSII